ncbi:MAG: ROK family protein, partial [Planctomycetes bacterium]|nr:ROK family protein [Planctomycetota bacterium]
MKPTVAIGIDLGGTNLRVAVVDKSGQILARQIEPTHAAQGPDVVMDRMVRLGDSMLGTLSLTRSDLVGVGVGCPGPLRIRDGCIIRTANLPGWNDVPLRDRLHAQFDLPVTLDNDANAAAYGEFWVGAGHGSEDLVMLTLGTGVGAGVVLGGCLLHGHFDNAAELGHMIVVPDGLPCRCGQRGCLEQYSSASAVAQRVITAIQAGEPCELAERVQAGNEPNDAARVATRDPN